MNSSLNVTSNRTWWWDLLLLTLGIGVFLAFCLGSRALSIPDEGRYAEISREMLVLHDFITPHLDGVKYFEKPAWVYWMGAASLKAFGYNEWAARLPSMLMAVLGCLTTYAAGRYLFDRRTGLYAAVMLTTSVLYFAMAHSLTLDMTLSVWLAVSLSAFICAVETPAGTSTRRWLCYSAFAAAALAVLTKGLVGLLFPGMIVFLWLLLCNRWHELKHLYLVSGSVIFLVIALPWHLWVQHINPEFFHFYVIDQHFTRYLTKAMDRYQPWWWFGPILIGGLLPWTFFLPQALRQVWPQSWALRYQVSRELFLALWAVFIFVFFSLSNSKLIPYLVPVFPPLALLIARYWARVSVDLVTLKRSGWATLIFLCLMALGLVCVPHFDQQLSRLEEMNLRILAAILVLWSIATALCLCRCVNARLLLWVLALGSGVFCWAMLLLLPSLDTRSIKGLALQVKALATPADWVVGYGTYYQDLPFYSQRQVIIVDWLNELSFGLAHQPKARQWVMDVPHFWALAAHTQHPIYIVLDVKKYHNLKVSLPLTLVAVSGSDVLVRVN